MVMLVNGYAWWRTTQQTILKKLCQNICNKSKEQQQKCICNSNKNIMFVEANAMNISAKFQLYPPYSCWGVDFLIIVRNKW